MGLSFTATETGALFKSGGGGGKSAQRRRVLVTGATGNIGQYFAEHSHEKYDLRLMVRDASKGAELADFGEVVTGDLGDLDGLKRLCHGIDSVLHLAADARPDATWSSVLDANIIGAYHAFIAAKAAGCRRLIFASSVHAVSGYPADVQVKTSDPVNPGDLYGVSKCFGEALGRYMAEKEGLSVIALRIGAFQPREAARSPDARALIDAFVSRRDLNQLIEKCIDAEGLRFAIFNGLSDNRFKRLDITDARELVGYAPQDDLAAENPEFSSALGLHQDVRTHNRNDPQQKSGIREEL